MLKFFKPRARHILLIDNEGLSVYTLVRKRLVHYAKFSDGDAGYENFRNFLEEQNPSAVTLLIDSAIEDFIVETVPHVNQIDRKKMLKRKLGQHFRGSAYASIHLIGREESGRRDDKVLFSALTRDQFVDPWMRKLLQQRIPVNSITTPAFALTHVAKHMGILSSDAVLLVNWESSGLRQSYVADGKLMFSRLTPAIDGDPQQLVAQIVDACRQSREYLERIGLLADEKPLDIHVITPQLDNDAFDSVENIESLGRVMHHNSIDMMELDKFGGAQESITATLLCLNWGVRRGQFPNIYAPSAALQYFHLSQVRRAIVMAMVLMFGATAMLTTPLLLDAIDRTQATQATLASIAPVRSQYESMRARFPETPIPAQAMELAVRHYNLISNHMQSPFERLAQISTVLASQNGITLTSLDWNYSSVDSNGALNQAVLNQPMAVSVEINGTLLGSTSAQALDSRMTRLMNDLAAIPGASVIPVSLPITPDPFAAVNTVINDEVVDEEFSLLIRFEA